MTDEQRIHEALKDLEPRDPLEVLAAELPADEQGRVLPQGLRPEGSFEMAWRLAH